MMVLDVSKFYKKAEMGVGTLVIFIAMLLVAAVAAGVLIQTSGALQEKSITTGNEARGQIATSAFTVSIAATDGRNRNLTDFMQIMRLNPGSEPISLDSVMLTVNTKDSTASLEYRGIGSTFEQNNQDGYNTWMAEEFGQFSVWNNDLTATLSVGPGFGHIFDSGIDFDNDGITDSFRTCDDSGAYCPTAYDGKYLVFHMTLDGDVYVPLINDDGSSVDISLAANGFNFTNLDIGEYGFIDAWRTAGSADDWIDAGDTNFYFEIFKAPATLEEDIDDDSFDDRLSFDSNNAIITLGSNETITIPLGVDISNPSVNVQLLDEPIINSEGEELGYLTIDAPNAGNGIIPADDIVTITPKDLGQGYFSVVYETRGTNYIEGKFQRGDVINLYYQSPGPVGQDQEVWIRFIPKIGTTTLSMFITPDVISEQRTYLYP